MKEKKMKDDKLESKTIILVILNLQIILGTIDFAMTIT